MKNPTRHAAYFALVLALALPGAAIGEDDMMMPQAAPMQQPPPAAPAQSHSHPGMATMPAPATGQPTTATMADHLQEMADQLRQTADTMAAMEKKMREQSAEMHRRSMSLKSGHATAADDMDALAAMQHLERMKHDLQHWEMQNQQIDSSMQMMDSSMSGSQGQKKDHM